MEFDYEASVEVAFAEDLSYSDVAPILDALAATPIFIVRGSRVGWSGPAAGGPEVGLILTAVATVGGAAFAGTFCSELAKDTYKGARAAILAVVRRLRNREPEERRAMVGVAIHVLEVKICVGPLLEREPKPDEWSDEWFVDRLLRAQAIIDERVGRVPGAEADMVGPRGACEDWLK